MSEHKDSNEPLEIISLGAGVQSSVMALMAARGELTPMPDAAIFADTQFEPRGVYEHLDWLEQQLPFPTHRVTAGDIQADHLAGRNTTGQRFASMPLFTESGGMGRRQCTREYKIDPVRKKLRELIGLKPRQRAPKHSVINLWMGISTDESLRMKPSRHPFYTHIFPLIDARISRNDCEVWFQRQYPGRTLSKSACVACPFHNDALWRDMKINDPDSFAAAVEFDHAIRENGSISKGYKEQQYVHRSCQPLDEVDLRNAEDLGQLNFFNNECEGMCGV
jgi:hypothetical protein